MIDQRIAEFAGRQHGVITRQQLISAGLSSGAIGQRVRRHRLFPVFRGVFALSPHLEAWGRRYAAVLSVGGRPLGEPVARPPGAARSTHRRPAVAPTRLGPALNTAPEAGGAAPAGRIRIVLSHWSVLHLHGLIEHPPESEHVTIEGTGSRPYVGVRVHRGRTLQAEDVEFVAGLPVTTPARTILDSALGASVRQVQRLIREAEYRELLGFGALEAVIRRNPFHPATPIVRKADPQTAEARLLHTPIEDRMAQVIAGLTIDQPESQLVVVGRSGLSYRADFAWPASRLIVEADGRSSHDRSTSFQSDRGRDADLAAAGWLTLRFTSLQLDQPERVAATIVATVATRPAPG